MIQHIKRILSNYKLLWSKFRWIIWLTVVENATEFALPFIIKQMYDIISSKWISQDLWKRFGMGLWVLFIVEITSRWFWILYHYLRQVMDLKLKDHYKKQLAEVEVSRIYDIGTGKLLSKFERWINATTQVFFEITQSISAISIRWMWVIIVFAFYQPKLLLPLALFAAIFITLELWLGKKAEVYTEKIRETNEQASKLNVRYFSEFTMVKIYNKFQQEQEEFQSTTKNIPYWSYMQEALSAMKYSILYFGLEGTKLFLIAYLGSQLITSWGDISIIIMLAWYLMWIRRPIEQATRSMSLIRKELGKYIELQQFISQPSTIINWLLPYSYQHGDIDFKNIKFGYNDVVLFDNFNLTIAWWSKIALVGHSWSGKSTIVKLLLRLYDIQSGKITVDNQNISDLQISTLYDHIWYLTQEPSIFDGTIRENLEYGITNITQLKGDLNSNDQPLIDACRLAMFDVVLDKLELWLDTMVGERGIKLSWWEKQRLAIARLFLKNPKILILDEPTAALDSISERAITQALKIISTNRTTIIIAHRLQTVMSADCIIVMDHGQIIQSGTHQQLHAQSWLYQTLVNLQSGTIEE